MRVAVVSPYDAGRHGGVQLQCDQLVAHLVARRHDAWLVAPGTGGPKGTRHVGSTITVPVDGTRAPVTIDPAVFSRVRAALEGAEVVHVHEPFMPFTSWAALGAPAPVVGTFHAAPGRFGRVVYRVGSPGWRRVARRMTVVTAVSRTAAAAVEGIAAPRIVPNGIEVAAYRLDVERRARQVVFVGRDDPRKGLDVLLAAWPRVLAAVPDARLDIVGVDGAAPIPGIRFRGRVSEDQKRRLLAGAAVAVAPNLGGESFGLVVAEAMAAGCAVVASALQAFAAVVGDAALLVPPGDAEALGTDLAALLGDDYRVEVMAEAATRRVERFDMTRVCDEYVAAYRDALAGPCRGG
jgi:phosphatidylinositol alpha-mannosyltransferase